MRCSLVRMFAFETSKIPREWILIKPVCHVMVWGFLIACVSGLEVRVGVAIHESSGSDLDKNDVLKIIDDTKSLFENNNISQQSVINTTIHSFQTQRGMVQQALDLMTDNATDVIVSYTSYELTDIMVYLSNQYHKPLVIANTFHTYTCESYAISICASFLSIAQGLSEFLQQFQWGNLAVFYGKDVHWQQMVVSIENHLLKSAFHIKHSSTIDNVNDHAAVLEQLEKLTDSEKAVILAMDVDEAAAVVKAASSWSSLTKHTLILILRNPYSNLTLLNNVLGGASNYSRVLQSVFILSPTVPKNIDNPDVKRDVTSPVLSQSQHLLQDALATMFQGYTSIENGSSVRANIPMIMKDNLVNVLGRLIAFDSTCTRYVHFSLYDYDVTYDAFTLVRYIWQGSNCVNNWCYQQIREISWPGGVVIGADECFRNDNCNPTSGVNIALAVAIPLSLIAVGGIVAIVLILIWRIKTKRLMTKGPNKILLEHDDLVFLHRKDIKGSKITNGGFLDTPDLLKASEKSNRSMVSLHEWTEFSEIARYKGDIVYLKELKVKGIEMKGNILAYTKILRDVRHENVNPLYGFLNDPVRPALVSEYCNRGSLSDVLKNEYIKLDWDFKVSLLTDLVRGLRYIQGSHIRYHGNLGSRNCVIDSRWVLKLTDFGMSKFRDKAKIIVKYEPHELLWTAPEHLREPIPASKGSEKGDMYSLSIIMQEVILRKRPFGMIDLTPEEILHKVQHPPPLLRPKVSPQAAQPQYIQLMKECWSENPELRPSIEDVYQQFKAIQGGKKMNIVDSMFRMLEKYSNDLEDLVKERTTQLEEEKKKTDVLLFRMLPASVAESLKLGRPIEAETFEEVTIYFSDIVGFTTISAMSTPMQVVDLLNDLYTLFDATIDTYCVYKVETIGDAYMVVGGLPIRNENHAGDIATMALDLLSECGSFTIRHMPEVPLRLRIGLHSGSCVAGVVGLTMPRYCLFGDTVNTASRMESSGMPFRVHISDTTKRKLDEIGGYLVTYRGEIELKGKGMHSTHWLVGKEGYSRPLPEPPSADGSNHGLESLLQNRKMTSLNNTPAMPRASLSSTPATTLSSTSAATLSSTPATTLSSTSATTPSSTSATTPSSTSATTSSSTSTTMVSSTPVTTLSSTPTTCTTNINSTSAMSQAKLTKSEVATTQREALNAQNTPCCANSCENSPGVSTQQLDNKESLLGDTAHSSSVHVIEPVQEPKRKTPNVSPAHKGRRSSSPRMLKTMEALKTKNESPIRRFDEIVLPDSEDDVTKKNNIQLSTFKYRKNSSPSKSPSKSNTKDSPSKQKRRIPKDNKIHVNCDITITGLSKSKQEVANDGSLPVADV